MSEVSKLRKKSERQGVRARKKKSESHGGDESPGSHDAVKILRRLLNSTLEAPEYLFDYGLRKRCSFSAPIERNTDILL